VPERVVVEGVQNDPLRPGSHAWLFIRARVAGGRWYAGPDEVVARSDGAWSTEIYLDGPAGVRHEIRVGVVDAARHAELLSHLAERRDQPLDGRIPPAAWGEARLTVVKQ
jgi:hypothetical protein